MIAASSYSSTSKPRIQDFSVKARGSVSHTEGDRTNRTEFFLQGIEWQRMFDVNIRILPVSIKNFELG